MSELPERVLELVSIPSVTREEEALCRHLCAWSGAAPLWRNNVVLVGESRGLPRVGLFGHLDTVLPASDQPLGILEDRVYGCGASDMKAGVAFMMQAWEQRARWTSDLVCVFYDREEGPGEENGLEFIMDKLPPMDLAIVLEPTDNEVQKGCVGSLHARVSVRGKRAHAARPWQGQNALFNALPVLQKLQEHAVREVEVGGLTFREVVTPTTAATVNSRNVVPDHLELNVNYRFAPGKTCAQATRELHDLLGSLAEVEVHDAAPSGGVATHPLLDSWVTAHGLKVEPKQAWTDVARLTERGIPAVNFGPGDPAQAHQAREHVEIAALRRGWPLLCALLSAS